MLLVAKTMVCSLFLSNCHIAVASLIVTFLWHMVCKYIGVHVWCMYIIICIITKNKYNYGKDYWNRLRYYKLLCCRI